MGVSQASMSTTPPSKVPPRTDVPLRTIPPRRLRGWWAELDDTLRHYVIGLTSVAIFLAIWQLASAQRWVDPLFYSSPSAVFAALVKGIATGQLWPDLALSGQEFLWGFALAVVLAIPAGILTGWFRFLDSVTEPFVSGLYSSPYVAFMPLIILIFGIDVLSKVIIVFWATFFPIMVNTATGVKNVNPTLIRAAQAFCAPRWRILTTVALPASVPFILAGVRLGIGRGLVGVIVAEFFVSQAGLGHMVQRAASDLKSDVMFAGIAIIAITGIAMVRGVAAIERRFESWSGQQ